MSGRVFSFFSSNNQLAAHADTFGHITLSSMFLVEEKSWDEPNEYLQEISN